jgi:perosamine synthetase
MYVPPYQGLDPRTILRRPCAGPLPFPFRLPGQVAFHVARGGIYHLMRALRCDQGGVVLMPDYHSGVEVWAVRMAGATVRYYHINRRLEPDLDELRTLCADGPRVLYLIHYFGWPQPVEEVRALCRERGIILVEDCALSLLSEVGGRPLGSFGDHAVFCLYKTLPVPNGGLLVQNDGAPDGPAPPTLTPCDLLSVSARSAELVAEWLRARANGLGAALLRAKRGVGWTLNLLGAERLPVGDITPDFRSVGYDVGRLGTGMSALSRGLLERFDYAAIVLKRRENYARLRTKLDRRIALLDMELHEGVCPLFLPILVRDKGATFQELRRRGIGAVEVWNYGYPEARVETGPDAEYLRRHLLELPIHQDITPAQIDYMADQVLSLNPAAPG